MIRRWIPTIAYMLAIFVLSSMGRPPQILSDNLYVTTFEHVMLYLVLGVLFSYSLRSKDLFLPFLLVSLYGFSDEVHQFFVPGRTASALDVAADSLGAFLGALLWRRLRS